MGIGYRVFLVDESDRLHRISQRRFDELLDRERGGRVLGAFVGKDKVRYALVVYETEDRRPVAVLHEEYGILPVAADGTLDGARSEEVLGLMGRARSPMDAARWVVRRRGSVVDGNRRFAEKRLRHEWEWWPSAELWEEILAAVFG